MAVKSRKNVWEEAEILPMAIRLRKCGKCPPEIDAIYGKIIIGVVELATKTMPDNDPKYKARLPEFLDEEVQAQMVFNALRAAEKFVDAKRNPRTIVNYLVKAVQNRLRNWVRDTTTRRMKADIVNECDTKMDIVECCAKECNLEGAVFWKENRFKVNTNGMER